MFKLVISPQAQKELKRISKEHQRAIRIALSDLKQDPFVGKSLTRELTGKFSYRVSVYRIIYEAPASLRSGYLLPVLRRERNSSEAEISSHSSVSLRSRFSAKGDKLEKLTNCF